MTELSGTLEGAGLPAIVRFLAGLKKTGCLLVTHDAWRGEVFFVEGQVTGAHFGSRYGLSALDALVQALPAGRFSFDVVVGAPDPNISLSPEALETHLDRLVAASANGTPGLPSLESVPVLVGENDGGNREEPLPLDRGMLQTLLAVDGQRTVRDVVAERGSFDALWQLGTLAEVGLVRIGSPLDGVEPASSPRTTPLVDVPLMPLAPPAEALDNPAPRPPVKPVVSPKPALPVASPDSPRPEGARRVEPVAVASPPPRAEELTRESEPSMASARACPKLGFDDDPKNSFGRPTRLHRCFAAGAPLSLSLEQQRELCLSDEFSSCPRLSTAGGLGGGASALTGAPASGAASPDQREPVRLDRLEQPERLEQPDRPEPAAHDPRIVRLPIVARADPAERGAVVDRSAIGRPEPTRLRSPELPGSPAAPGPPAPGPPAPDSGRRENGVRPTLLRARGERSNGAAPNGAAAEPPSTAAAEPPNAEAVPERRSERRIGGLPLPTSIPVSAVASGVVMVLGGLAVLVYLFVPQVGSLFGDDSLDPSSLPNGSAVLAGTPVTELASARATPLSVLKPTGTGGAIGNATAASQPGVSQAAANQPAVPLQPTADLAPSAGQPAAAQQPVAAVTGSNRLLDERFANNDRNWPSSPLGTAFLTNGSYRLTPRQAGQFVAVGAPRLDDLHDVVVTATFRKLSGPAGGGAGIIVRDQSTTPRDGTSQNGRYYVLEAGDKGEVGMWRRDADHWVDLLPWQHADAVKPGNAANELSVRAVGDRLSLTINGTEVATRADASLTSGGVGLFVGGDGNQVGVEHFSVQAP